MSSFDSYAVTCLTEDCSNAGIEIEIHTPRDEPPFVICGVCTNQITDIKPIQGCGSNGRLGWNNPQNKRVTISYSSTRSTKKTITPLLSIKILGAAAQMVDSAGKAKRTIPPKTSPYPYKGGTRSHRVTRQGIQMTKNLRARKWVSFAYKSILDIKPQLEGEARLVVERYAKLVNKRI